MSDDSTDSAWKIHSALVDWTGKVDTKASFALTLEAAILSAIVLLTRPQQPISQIASPLGLVVFWLGCALLGGAALAAVSVVIPRTRANQTAQEWPENYVYFGHLRHWNPDDLTQHLRASDSDILPVLSRQLVNMSKIAWIKHRRVQLSLILAVAGVFLTAVASLSG